MLVTSDELKKIIADSQWWQSAGDLVDLQLMGFTFRTTAQFQDKITKQTIELRGSVAERLIVIGEHIDGLRKAGRAIAIGERP